MEHKQPSKSELADLYETTRRLSSWLVMLTECPWIKDECRADVLAWLESIPRDWWVQFHADDDNENQHGEVNQ